MSLECIATSELNNGLAKQHGSVPQDYVTFYASIFFENTICNVHSICGISYSLAIITSGHFEAYYDMGSKVRNEVLIYFRGRLMAILPKYEHRYLPRMKKYMQERVHVINLLRTL